VLVVGVAVDVGKFVLNVFVPVNAFVPANVTAVDIGANVVSAYVFVIN
jgi:hypothetical protein